MIPGLYQRRDDARVVTVLGISSNPATGERVVVWLDDAEGPDAELHHSHPVGFYRAVRLSDLPSPEDEMTLDTMREGWEGRS